MPATPTIGLLGGGQLGLMLCEAAVNTDVNIAILDAQDAPAKAQFPWHKHVTGSFKSPDKVRELASRADLLTVEIEHVDTSVLKEIAETGLETRVADGTTSRRKVTVHPSWRSLELVQDKYLQKEFFKQKGLPVAEQMAVAQGDAMLASMKEATETYGLPWMLKARKDSYDGRGNFKVSSQDDYDEAIKEFGSRACYAEKWVPFVCELAVMVVRTEDDAGKTKAVTCFPAVETVHEDSICSKVYMPPRQVGASQCVAAQKLARAVVSQLWGRGVFAVEMFVTKNDQIMINEIAPRPHNSGHLTIEAVPQMSQFKAQLHAILDLPIPETLKPTVESSIMINVLGGLRATSHLALLQKAKELQVQGVRIFIHDYGKQSKPGRKIGHITATGTMPVKDLETAVLPLINLAQAMRQERSTSSGNSTTSASPLVLVTMGSDSDLNVLTAGIDMLKKFGVPFEIDITSAHRTADKTADVAKAAMAKGIKVIIAAAGGAAHLPGMIAAHTVIPVIGVPVKATHLDGMDSILSILQMPGGVPVATVGVNNSTNAALLSIQILGAAMPEYRTKMVEYREELEKQVNEKAQKLQELGPSAYLEMKAKNGCVNEDAGTTVLHPLKIFELAKSRQKLVYACAPMVRYSKLAFRQTVFEYGTDLCWTPMILAKEFNRSHHARDSDFSISTRGPQPPTIIQFGANSPLELSRASSLVAPWVNGIDLNCGCPQSWACAETLGAALMDQRELVRDMVIETRQMLKNDGWAVGLDKDINHFKGRSISVKIRVHQDLRKTIDFISTVLGHPQARNVDFLTIHPRTRSTASSTPINTEALEILTEKYGDILPIMLSGDVFSLQNLPFRTLYLPSPQHIDDKRPYLPKLAGVMSARGLLSNPALFAGYETCPWEAVDKFMNKVIRAPLPLKLIQHHLSEMCGPALSTPRQWLLGKQERQEMLGCMNMCDLIDFLDGKSRTKFGRDGGLDRV